MILNRTFLTCPRDVYKRQVENLLCFAAAFILDLALVQLLRPTAPQTFALALTAGVYIGAFVFGAGMVLLVTWATTRYYVYQNHLDEPADENIPVIMSK